VADRIFLQMLISTGLVSRRAAAYDDGNGAVNNTDSYEPVMVNGVQLSIACRVAQQSARARTRAINGGKDVNISTLTMFTDYRTDVLERDRVLVEGQIYDLESPNDPGLMHHHLEFPARRVS
jgi:SPP1 family predicted phage head-tail adaptor